MTATVSPLRILKLGTCKTLSEQSELRYQIAVDVERQIYIRITGNSSSGKYAKEAFSLAGIQEILASRDPAKPFTSVSLQPAFVGRSQNMAGFALAILLAEGLIEIVSPEDRRFRCADGSQFFKAIDAMTASGMNLQDDTPALPSQAPAPAASKKSKKVAKLEVAAAE